MDTNGNRTSERLTGWPLRAIPYLLAVLSIEEGCKAAKVSKATVTELAIEIANLKAIELQALREKFFLLKDQRIELFGERLQALGKELGERDFKDMPTEKLFDLLQKLYGQCWKRDRTGIFSGRAQSYGYDGGQFKNALKLESLEPKLDCFLTASSLRRT